MIRYTYKHMGISGATPEYNPGRYGGEYNGSTDLFYFLMQLSNYLIGAMNAFWDRMGDLSAKLETVESSVRQLETGLLAQDSFNRANGSIGKADTGQMWQTLNMGHSIVDNKLKSPSIDDNISYVDVHTHNFEVVADLSWDSYASLVFRFKDNDNYLLVRLNSLGLALYSKVAGTANELKIHAFTPVKGTTYNVRVHTLDTVLTIYLNDVEVISFSTSDHLNETKIGFRTVNDTLSTFDNFKATSFASMEGFQNTIQALSKKLDLYTNGYVALDKFDRPNSTTLGTADTGQPWLNDEGSFSISSGKAKAAVSEFGNAKNYLDAGTSNIEASVDVSWHAYAGLHFRYKDGNNYLMARINNNSLALTKFDGTSVTLGTYAFAPVAGTVYRLKVLANGTSIRVYLDGVERISVTESAFLTEKKVGFRVSNNDSNSTFDNFEVKRI